jgi:hypothetical protein
MVVHVALLFDAGKVMMAGDTHTHTHTHTHIAPLLDSHDGVFGTRPQARKLEQFVAEQSAVGV